MLEKQLLVVTGKGGVGKSTIAAVLGTAAAERRRTLVIEVDPRENVHRMLGVEPSGGEIVGVRDDLWLQNLDPRHVVDQIVRDRLPVEMLLRRVLASPVYQQFSQGAPGLKELAVLGRALEIIEGRVRGAPGIDLVVLDAPATGHGLSLLAAPGLVSEAIERGPVAEMTREVSEWVESQRVGVVAVTTAEEMPISETLELIEALDERFSRRPELMVVNQIYPRLPASYEGVDALGRMWRSRRQLNERESLRLTRSWHGPTVELPLLAEQTGPELVRQLADRLRDGLQESAP